MGAPRRRCGASFVPWTGEIIEKDENLVEGLNGLLADTTVLYQKLRHYHWDITGKRFFELHVKFEEL